MKYITVDIALIAKTVPRLISNLIIKRQINEAALESLVLITYAQKSPLNKHADVSSRSKY